MRAAATVLDELAVPYRALVISAHRTPERLYAFGRAARDHGYKVIIAGAANAGLLAAQILALSDPDLAARLTAWREARTLGVPEYPHADTAPA